MQYRTRILKNTQEDASRASRANHEQLKKRKAIKWQDKQEDVGRDKKSQEDIRRGNKEDGRITLSQFLYSNIGLLGCYIYRSINLYL